MLILTLKNLDNKDSENNDPPPRKQEDIFTYRKHSMDYFTVDGVTLRTGFSEILLWYLLCIRELLDNAVDFLTKNYKGADDTVIDVTAFKDDKTFRRKVRNSNYKNIPVFANLNSVFDYDMRYGSKQDVHVISRGMLGDALKQILAFEYILIHVDYNSETSFQDKQSKYPLVIRYNGIESKVYLNVDRVRQTASHEIVEQKKTKTKSTTSTTRTDTEIELVLPIVDHVRNTLDKKYIMDFCKKYPLFTTDINFRFHITDNSNYEYDGHGDSNDNSDDNNIALIASSIAAAATAESPKATTHIEYQALHPISSESWNRQNSVHSYTPEEFKRRITNVDPNQAANIRLYDILVATFREASNLAKDDKNQISVAQLLKLDDRIRNKQIKDFYKQLKNTLRPPSKLILPYTTNKQKRKLALISRVARYHNNDIVPAAEKLDIDGKSYKPSYRSMHGYYNDEQRGISYPYFFEILAIPFANPKIARNHIEFVGAINYSISPKTQGSIFEGNYE